MTQTATKSITDTPWHSLNGSQAANRLNTVPEQGLAQAVTVERLARVGKNQLAAKPPRSRWLLFLDQFRNLLVFVLIGAALLAGAIGDLKDAVVILAVVVLNAALGFIQENRAESTLAALKKMLSPIARVRRNGKQQKIDAAELVPGDIVLLEAGDRVPADGRILVAHNAQIDESALTGESHPVSKATETLDAVTPLAERSNMAYMNSVVTRGRLELLATATGMETEMGRLAGMLEAAEPGPTPLQVQLDGLGKWLAAIAVGVVSVIFALGILQNHPLVQILITSIALAVAAIPEGLPAVVTITLALGMHQMAQRRAIVKRLHAVETLGCTTVICSDKTGTLTLNQMTARAIFYRGQRLTVSGEGYSGDGDILPESGADVTDLSPLLMASTLANDSRIQDGRLIGDPTEGALLALAAKGGFDVESLTETYPRIAEIPFDSTHKFMASFHLDGGTVRLWIKGAPDVLLARSQDQLDASGETRMDSQARSLWETENSHLASQAMRVLAVAYRDIPAVDFSPVGDLMRYADNLTLIGLVGIIDPPRPEAREAIRLCHRAGIEVKMITGDHRLTATAIAEKIGLTGEVLSGAELDTLNEEQLNRRIDAVSVFARVAPEHKVRIVRALQNRREVVAMTGDGVNDAPALKQADIGVAMGINGTDVTREAASMVLTDDNFATIVSAVKQGRNVYENIIKFVRFQLSTNIGAILTVLGASLLGLSTPFTAIQILWINIIMDGPPAMSLGVEPARANVMDEAPRKPGSRVLSGPRLFRLFIYGLTMAVGTLGIFYFALPQGEPLALTLAFTTFVLFQFFNVFNARSEHGSAFNHHFLRNRYLWMSLGAVLLLQLIVVHWPPAQSIFRTVDLSLANWGLAALVASSVLLLEETRKLVLRLWQRHIGSTYYAERGRQATHTSGNHAEER